MLLDFSKESLCFSKVVSVGLCVGGKELYAGWGYILLGVEERPVNMLDSGAYAVEADLETRRKLVGNVWCVVFLGRRGRGKGGFGV